MQQITAIRSIVVAARDAQRVARQIDNPDAQIMLLHHLNQIVSLCALLEREELHDVPRPKWTVPL